MHCSNAFLERTIREYLVAYCTLVPVFRGSDVPLHHLHHKLRLVSISTSSLPSTSSSLHPHLQTLQYIVRTYNTSKESTATERTYLHARDAPANLAKSKSNLNGYCPRGGVKRRNPKSQIPNPNSQLGSLAVRFFCHSPFTCSYFRFGLSLQFSFDSKEMAMNQVQ